MNIFNKVTLQSLKKNKTQTTVTIIGIILSSAMLCAVMTSASSFMHYLKEDRINMGGDWHGRITSIDYSLFEKVREDENVSDALLVQELGYSRLEGAFDKDRPYLYVLAFDSSAPSFLPVHLVTGNYPTSPQEIILPDNLTRDSGIVYRVGDEITLQLGDRIQDGRKLGQFDPCREIVEGKPEVTDEVLTDRETRTYTVTGFYDRLGSDFEAYNSPGYTAFTFIDQFPENSYSYDIYFRLKKPQDFSEVMQNGSFPVMKSIVEKNTDLLMFYGEAPFENFYKMMYSMVAIVVGLIMFGSVSLIYNAFSISVSERIRQFGLLSSVGATRTQIRHSVFFEAFVVSLVGIPLGILTGIGGIGITFLLIGDKFKAMGFSTPLHIHLSFFHILITVVIALITVFISVLIPSAKATKTSAMEAIRQNDSVRITGKPEKTSHLVYRMFGLSGILAGKYYKRNKSKYRITIVSLFMSIVLFVSAFSFTDYLIESVNGGIGNAEYDLSVRYDPNLKGNISEEVFLEKIKKIETVKEAAVIRDMYIDTKIDKKEITGKVLDEKHIWTNNSNENDPFVNVSAVLIFVDDDAYRNLLEENGQSVEKYMDPDHPQAVVVDENVVYNGQNDRYESIKYLKNDHLEIKIPQHRKLKGYWYNTVMENEEGKKVVRYIKDDGQDGGSGIEEYKYVPAEEALYDLTLSVGKVINDRPYYIDNYTGLNIIYPVSMINRILEDYDTGLNPCQFFMLSKDHRKTYTELKTMIENERISTDYIDDRAAEEEDMRNIITIIRVFAYGFIILISLIAAANVFNTITTNLNLRRREFAMLKSVGMTESGFRKMMNYECLLYGTKALLYGLPVSAMITFMIWESAGIGYETEFRLPWTAMGIACCSVFAVVFVTMLYSMNKLKKENLIEALKNENA